MKPPRSILDQRFKYRNAANTDVRRTFRKARLLQRLQRQPENAVIQLVRKAK